MHYDEGKRMCVYMACAFWKKENDGGEVSVSNR